MWIDIRRKVKVVLAQQNRMFSELAAGAGLTETTVYNVLNGRASSRKSKQLITNALGVQLWPEIHVTQRHFTFRAGVQIELSDTPSAREWAEELGDAVRRDERSITFVKNLVTIISDADNRAPAEKRDSEIALDSEQQFVLVGNGARATAKEGKEQPDESP